jgi:hypothetical protein
MVIGERFAWGHLQKTAGDATLGLFGLFPDLIVFADPRNTEAKHASFAEREAQIRGKVLAANLRRLPAWTLSWAQQRAREGRRPDDRPVPMNSPEQMVRVPRADVRLAALTDGGRFKIDRWLRTEHLGQDFCDFVSEFTDVDDETRKRILEFPSVNALSYDHDVEHWFTPERIRRLYENNPLWAEAEREAYGDLALLD